MYYHVYAEQPETRDEADRMYGVPFEAVHTNQVDKKEEWIAALRSGNYEQGRQSLCSGGKYCCLGVYAELQNVPSEKDGRGFKQYYFNAEQPQTGMPTGSWAREKGFITPEGNFHIDFELFGEKYRATYTLVDLNDTGFTFDQIADVIDYFF